MFRKLVLTVLELAPWLLRPLTEILPGDDNRGTMDPDG